MARDATAAARRRQAGPIAVWTRTVTPPHPRTSRNLGRGGPAAGETHGCGEKNGSAPSSGTRTTSPSWKTRFDWQEPSTLAVVLAQEDLWVIEALLRVIANTNEGTTYATAAVKQIHSMQIGKDAVGERQGEESIFRGATGQRPRRKRPGRYVVRRTEQSAPTWASAQAPTSDDQRLVENRYVDDKGKPLPIPSRHVAISR